MDIGRLPHCHAVCRRRVCAGKPQVPGKRLWNWSDVLLDAQCAYSETCNDAVTLSRASLSCSANNALGQACGQLTPTELLRSAAWKNVQDALALAHQSRGDFTRVARPSEDGVMFEQIASSSELLMIPGTE